MRLDLCEELGLGRGLGVLRLGLAFRLQELRGGGEFPCMKLRTYGAGCRYRTRVFADRATHNRSL